jgi:transposase
MKFRSYSQGQVMLLPPDIQEKIPKNHLIRAINTVVEQLDMQKLYNSYSEE